MNIQLYSLAPTQSHGDDNEENIPEIAATLLCRPHHHYTSSLYLNLYKNHLSYIKDLAGHSKSFCCSRCGKYWKRESNLRQHEKRLDLWRQSVAQVSKGGVPCPKDCVCRIKGRMYYRPGNEHAIFPTEPHLILSATSIKKKCQNWKTQTN